MIRPLEDGDELSFIGGIREKSLRAAYGFPPDMDDGVSAKIFRRFCGLERAFALTRRASGEMIGFLLDVDPELPENCRAVLPENGRTLAFAVFPHNGNPCGHQCFSARPPCLVSGQVFGNK